MRIRYLFFIYLFFFFSCIIRNSKVIHQWHQRNVNEIKNSTGLTRPSNSYNNNINNKFNPNQNQNAAPVAAVMVAMIAMAAMAAVMEVSNHHNFLHEIQAFIHMNYQRYEFILFYFILFKKKINKTCQRMYFVLTLSA